MTFARLIIGSALSVIISSAPLHAATWYVAPSGNDANAGTNWAAPKLTIQSAIDAASAGDLVLVSNGVYATGGKVISFGMTNRVAIDKPITVQSVNGPAVTIIQGAGPFGPSAVRCAYVGTNATLAGFTLTNGFTVITNNVAGSSGGGAFVQTVGSAAGFVSNCVIVGNSAWLSGGGVYAGSVAGSRLAGNYARTGGGGADLARLIDCVVSNNSTDAVGGGMSGGWARGTLFTHNTAGTSGGGISGGHATNCVIAFNTAGTDGGGINGGSARNSAIYGNTAGLRGGGCAGGTGNSIVNCTVAGNRAAEGGGIHGSSVTNSIVYHNSALSGENWAAGAFGLTCTFPLPPGSGNITNDPVLASPYRIAPSSPCVGAGAYGFTAGTDIDGEFWNTPPSLGCDEINVGSISGPLTVRPWASATNVAVGHPIRFIADIVGRVTSSRWNFADGTLLTNRAIVSRSYATAGVYAVVLTAFNGTFPAGVSATTVVQVASQQVHYVRLGNPTPVAPYTNWATAATNIQHAIDAATQIGALVLVSNGTYNTGGRAMYGAMTNRVVIDKIVTVRSVNGPSVTTIAGAGPLGDSAIRGVWVGNDATLSGFTITGGHTRTNGTSAVDQARLRSGGGAWCEGLGEISNCVIVGNTAHLRGGGVQYGAVYDSTLSGNSAVNGGGASEAFVFRSRLAGNTATAGGGAILGSLSFCRVESNVVADAGGGVSGGAHYNCHIAYNIATNLGGGARDAALYNCAVFGNRVSGAGLGGGGTAGGTNVNCTIVYNDAGGEGGGARNSKNFNSILYYNTGFLGPNWYGNSSSYSNTCSTPLPPGEGNIGDDPLLIGAARLSTGSPCRAAGRLAFAVGTDMDGEAWANPPSMGCDEPVIGALTGAISVAFTVSATNAAPGSIIRFEADVSGRVGRIAWNFGDGNGASNWIVTHAYSSTGLYPATLTAFNETFPAGLSATVSIHVVSQIVHYVNASNATPAAPFTSWATAATNIQQAINAATQIGALILVTNGTYNTGTTTQRSVALNRIAINKPVVVRSVNGPAATVIAGAVGVRGAYVGTNALLSGFTITGGRTPTIGSSYYEDYHGGGVWCEASAMVSNCVLRGNGADSGGGGVFGGTIRNSTIVSNFVDYAEGGGGFGATFFDCLIVSNYTRNLSSSGSGGGVSESTLYNCVLEFNRAGLPTLQEGGGAYASLLIGCTVRSNVALKGGGVRSSTVSNSVLVGNAATEDGGGAYASTVYDSTVISNVAILRGGGLYGGTAIRSEIVFNRAANGGGMHSGTGLYSRLLRNVATDAGGGARGGNPDFIRLDSCLVFSNTARVGGGTADARIYNCTIAGNVATNHAGGFYKSASSAASLAANCIIYFNHAPSNANWAVDPFPAFDLVFTCTTPTNSYTFASITNDPQYVNFAATNLRLQASSPCLNAGDTFYVFFLEDLDGNPRISGGTVDMGAYEFQSGPADTDGDGIPDWWESLHYGGPTNANPNATAANGVNSVLDAWIADLNPTNPASVFQVVALTNIPSGMMTISFDASSTARVYQLHANTNLLAAPQLWETYSATRTGTGAGLQFIVTNDLPHRNYRAGVRLP